MNVTVTKRTIAGEIDAIPSKSHAHRLLICAALGDAPVFIECSATSRDIEATACCLRALGASIERREDGYFVEPIDRDVKRTSTLDCGESGSTLRFVLPVCAALGGDFRLLMSGRLPARPLSPLYEILSEGGVTLSEQGRSPLCVSGRLLGSEFFISADVSSQFISGLLLCAPLLSGETRITLTTPPESAGYIDMTVDAMRSFGVCVSESDLPSGRTYTVSGDYRTPKHTLRAEGDWSNAAFWLAAGAMGEQSVTVRGLEVCSHQPDREMLNILSKMGACVSVGQGRVTVSAGRLRAVRTDVSGCPDLAPVLSVLCAAAEGESLIEGAGRLRLKESDRIEAVCAMLRSLGGRAEAGEDHIRVYGTGLSGGVVDSFGDHRIAMSAVVASACSVGDITILGAESTEKSYPAFFADLDKLSR